MMEIASCSNILLYIAAAALCAAMCSSESKAEWNKKKLALDKALSEHTAEVEEWFTQWEELQSDLVIPEFKCNTLDIGDPPSSVHQLRPGDIKVVAAFGDSITSGNGVGADTLPGVAIENRGQSWCIGINGTIETDLTLPNILKEFNSGLIGGSYSRPGREDDRNRTHCSEDMPQCAQFNVAFPGGDNRDMIDQAIDLIAKMNDHPDVDIENDWKLVTLFIGGNDLCACCRRWNDFNPDAYTNSIKSAIELIKAEIPRVLFQVVAMFDITPLANVSSGIVCDIAQRQFCDCAVHNESTIEILKNTQMQYFDRLNELININGTYDGDDSFTVVLQPHMRDNTLPLNDDGEWDTSYVAPDCFHPNLKAHQVFAYALWNTMLMPVFEKPFAYPKEDQMEFKCPSEERPYIFTNDNSREYEAINKEPDYYLEWKARAHGVYKELEKYPQEVEEWIFKWEEGQSDFPIPEFTCEVSPPGLTPRSVHQLRPGDIKVVAAFGDSVTAGNGVGAEILPGVAIENRGQSWSIGVNGTIETDLTIPILLKMFNPDLIGGSYSRPERDEEGIVNRTNIHCSEIMPNCAQLNVAKPGATNRNMVDQAWDLITKMRQNPDIDMENDWKLLTLFIGGNDLCACCRRWDVYNPDYYTNSIKEAIDTIKSNVTRVLFQVVTMFDVTPLANVSDGIVCDIAQRGFCDCAIHNASTIDFTKNVHMEYWEHLHELININGTYDGDDSFTVVLQPHMRDLVVVLNDDGEWDTSYMAPDCFHPNLKAHQMFAYQLWNTMLMPVDEKPFIYPKEEEKTFLCPTEDRPYIFTNDNSRINRQLEVQKQALVKADEINPMKMLEEFINENAIFNDQLSDAFESYVNDGIEIPPFTCEVQKIKTEHKTDSVHRLQPADIDVIAAMGDSVTAGFGVGARFLPQVVKQNRGASWSIGGNGSIDTELTIANLIRKFNPDVIGHSYTGDSGSCSINSNCSQLNVAVGGATARNMPTQAERLVERVRNSENIDLENDWKLVTLFIGGNDLCSGCWSDNYLPPKYASNIQEALDIIKGNLPRTMVQVVNMFDVTPITNMSTGLTCDVLHRGFCSCGKFKEPRETRRETQLEYWRLLDELINVNGTYDNDDKFTVVLQPHLRDLVPPVTDDGEWDTSFFSPDCFHPNRKGHQYLAYQLWNIMLTPVQNKPYFYPLEDPEDMVFKCPTEENPFIYTNENSGLFAPKSEKEDNLKKWEKGLVEDEYEYENRIEKIENLLQENPEAFPEWEGKDTESGGVNEDDDDWYIPPFLCDVSSLPPLPANSVHELKPSDIKVVAAFGDSITASNGLGAETKPGVLVENRGESWSIGGNQSIETVLTVPNLIKQFNPNVVGWSWSRYSRLNRNETHCDERMDCAQLNVAKPGATNRGMAGQAVSMIERMKNENLTGSTIDFDNDWKLVTMFIGGNDLCRVCENEDSYSPDAYRDGIRDALDILHEELPRALVNLVIMFDITPLTNMSTGVVCDILHYGFCACAVNKTTRASLRATQLEYFNKLTELVESGRYDTSDNFTVVIQPHQRDIEPVLDEDGNIDKSYFSPDCFHPSRKGHQGFAYMLWNVMLMPVGKKPFKYDAYEKPEFWCPCQKHPYIFTNLNSDVDWEACEKNQTHDTQKPLANAKKEMLQLEDFLSNNLVETENLKTVRKDTEVSLSRTSLIAAVAVLIVLVVFVVIGLLLNMQKKRNKGHKAEQLLDNFAFIEEEISNDVIQCEQKL